MSDLLASDIENNPESFDFTRPALRSEIESLEAELGASLPDSFTEILCRFGQGVFLDNESLLGVNETEPGLGDLVSVNLELRSTQNLPTGLIVFHLGIGGMHAFDSRASITECPIVCLDEDTLEPGETYATFDEWYTECIRTEYSMLLD